MSVRMSAIRGLHSLGEQSLSFVGTGTNENVENKKNYARRYTFQYLNIFYIFKVSLSCPWSHSYNHC